MSQDAFLNAVTKVCTAQQDWVRLQNAKAALVYLWEMLPPTERRAFLGRLSMDEEHGFMPWRPITDRDDPELEAALRHWPYIMDALTGREREFGTKVTTTLSRQTVRFTDKQAQWIKEIYRRWRR